MKLINWIKDTYKYLTTGTPARQLIYMLCVGIAVFLLGYWTFTYWDSIGKLFVAILGVSAVHLSWFIYDLTILKDIDSNEAIKTGNVVYAIMFAAWHICGAICVLGAIHQN